ncbi:MAG: GNAT family N-acetyltransferase [Tannerella sp.]|jgi:predicted acetyltransferase|nr:GNAT family N-acetyltransferase [Tannerella sp.]
MKQQVIDLWKTSFEDTDDFIRLYFERVYREEHTLTLRENGRMISALQMLPYEITYRGATVPAAYICGVCTLPSERGKGRMNRLMLQAMDVMRDRNYALTVLIPASDRLFDYYERFGYTKAFDYSLETHHLSAMPPAPSSCRVMPHRDVPPDTLYAYFDRKQRERVCAVLHTAYDWDTILLDCLADGGDVWVALRRDGQPEGLALAVPTGKDTVYIKEILYEQADIKDTLIRHILTHFHRQTAQVRIPPTLSGARSCGMAHSLDRQPYDLRQGWMNLMLD